MLVSSPAHLRFPLELPPVFSSSHPFQLVRFSNFPVASFTLTYLTQLCGFLFTKLDLANTSIVPKMPSFNRLLVLAVLSLSVYVHSAPVREATGTSLDHVCWHYQS